MKKQQKHHKDAAAASAANFEDSDTSKVIDVKDFISMATAGGARYRKLVSDVADAVIKKVSLPEICGAQQTVQSALNGLNADFGDLSFGKDAEGNYGYKIGGADSVNPFNPLTAFAGEAFLSQGSVTTSSDNKGFTHTISGSANRSGTLLYIGYWWAPPFTSLTFSNATVDVVMPTINMIRDNNFGFVIGMVKFQATGSDMIVHYYDETNAGSTTIFHACWIFE